MRTVPDANILVHSAYASHYSRHLPCVTLIFATTLYICIFLLTNLRLRENISLAKVSAKVKFELHNDFSARIECQKKNMLKTLN